MVESGISVFLRNMFYFEEKNLFLTTLISNIQHTNGQLVTFADVE